MQQVNDEERLVVLLKICPYKFDAAAGVGSINRVVDFGSFPAISLTIVELR